MDTAWQDRIRDEIDCEFRFDETARVLYSTDASIYEIEPLGVAYPAHAEHVSRILRYAYERGIPVTPRGGGTSLGGQAVGRSIQVDFSRHMNRILEVNVEERWARIQPGVVLDELNAHLKPMGLALRAGRLSEQPGERRRHDRQQLLRFPFHNLRQDDRSRP